MRKRWIGALALVMGMALLGGCGDTEDDIWDSFNAEDYVTLGEYKGLQVSVAPPEEFDENDIEIKTKQMYFEQVVAEDGIKDRPVELLDMTNIDYEGKRDGVAFDGGTAQGATLLIGSGQFIPGFEDGLIGVMPGETVDINLTFPENYGNELAGQDVVFTVTVNFIPQMEEEQVEGLGIEGVTTLEELHQYAEDSLNAQAKSAYLNNLQNAAMNQVMMSTTFTAESPESLLKRGRETYAELLDQMVMMYYGIDARTLYGDEYEDTLNVYAEQYARETLVIKAIADREGLNLSDSELDARMEEAAKMVGTTVEGLLEEGLTKTDYRESFLNEDVLNFVVENTTNTEI
ncbi:MAG: FKBP-type peptidyl-prolyl cis-trans isomerase [Butyrivibrio sp.]|nr:FKBP-type peptidyl-prolyl cis-trans isomerase [Muribaculum sp.]MCM1553595.1 FKBP-type peptidyl-prolyl cis-trans isomerase [Butyrivibrio sp.]